MTMTEKNRKGFTLLELLISASIFAIVVVVGIDLLFTVVKIEKRTNAVQTVESDSRNILEEMARSLRLGMIDYDYYAAKGFTIAKLRENNNDQKILAVRDQNNNQFIFLRMPVSATHWVIKSCSVLAEKEDVKKCDDMDNWEQITPENVNVEKFLIFVQPEVDPFKLNETTGKYYIDELSPSPSTYQPIVTIVLRTKTINKDQALVITSNLQTTVSSRLYLR